MNHDDVDIRVIDQRIGMGIGGMNTVIRAYHKPTGLLVEVPTRAFGRGSYAARQAALQMLEYGLAAIGDAT